MAKKYMDQSLFDVCASSLASMDINKTKNEEYKNHSMKDLLNIVKPTYEKYIIDDGVWKEVLTSAKNIQKLVKKTIFQGEFLREYSAHCMSITPEGKKTPLFNGLFFNNIFRKSVQLSNRKENSLKRAKNYFKLFFGTNKFEEDNISSSKKSKKKKTKPKTKSKKTNLKKDLEWLANKKSFDFNKIDRTKLIYYEGGYKPMQQYKSTRKFPLTGYWGFIEKHRPNNKWKAYLRISKNKYWEDVESSGYCKESLSAWDSLIKKLNKDD